MRSAVGLHHLSNSQRQHTDHPVDWPQWVSALTPAQYHHAMLKAGIPDGQLQIPHDGTRKLFRQQQTQPLGAQSYSCGHHMLR